MESPTVSFGEMAIASPPLISIVVPVFNEEPSLREFYREVKDVLEKLPLKWEIVFVNDGSGDGSLDVIRSLNANDERVRAVHFAKNFGNQIAISAGLEHARGDAVIIMDADLQHPPELIPELVKRWQDEHYESVYAQRTYDAKTSRFKRFTSSLFHKTLNVLSDLDMPEGVSDFRLLDRAVVDYLNRMKERPRFLRALICWLGFRQCGVPYTTHPRFAGQSKFSIRKLIQLSIDGITAFSTKPLRWITYSGFLVAAIGIVYAMYVVYETFFIELKTAGWPTLIITILLLGGMQLISLGVIGEYLGKTYMETKERPLYTVQERIGFGERSGDQSHRWV
ncbi:MAG: glycosyltransferase family 2 protein [Thermoguttaceae bacterium]